MPVFAPIEALVPRPIAVPMNNRKNRTCPHLKTQLGFGLSGGALVGLIGGAELAQAQTQPQSLTHTGAVYTPLDVLSAEPLEDFRHLAQCTLFLPTLYVLCIIVCIKIG